MIRAVPTAHNPHIYSHDWFVDYVDRWKESPHQLYKGHFVNEPQVYRSFVQIWHRDNAKYYGKTKEKLMDEGWHRIKGYALFFYGHDPKGDAFIERDLYLMFIKGERVGCHVGRHALCYNVNPNDYPPLLHEYNGKWENWKQIQLDNICAANTIHDGCLW